MKSSECDSNHDCYFYLHLLAFVAAFSTGAKTCFVLGGGVQRSQWTVLKDHPAEPRASHLTSSAVVSGIGRWGGGTALFHSSVLGVR